MYRYVKRVFDFLLSLLGLIILSLLLLLISIVIIIDSKGPILFKQKRIGMNKREFVTYKFRTMRVDAPHDTPTHLLKNANNHITGVGRLLRKTSLDELPQLWNILKGDMSIIGPRPALWNQYDLIEARDKYHVNEIKPGLTGWAQIQGRDELEIPKKAYYDGQYYKLMSFIMDWRCFWGTIAYVLKGKGVIEGQKE